MLPTATTDAEGRFELRGLGRDRMAVLRIVGPQIAVAVLQVVTRPMETTKILLRNRGGGPAGKAPRIFYGSHFEFVAKPGVPVEGRVTDEETGAPLAGVIVASDRFSVPRTLSSDGLLTAVSDAQGRFKLEGLPLSDENTLKVLPSDLPYLSAGDLSLPKGKPPQSIARDIKLRARRLGRRPRARREDGEAGQGECLLYAVSFQQIGQAPARGTSHDFTIPSDVSPRD